MGPSPYHSILEEENLGSLLLEEEWAPPLPSDEDVSPSDEDNASTSDKENICPKFA
jgi:hypothetical protein